MERELEQRIFNLEEYENKCKMEKDIKEFMKELKSKYQNAIVTREFYKGQNVLVRATEVYNNSVKEQVNKEKEIDDWHIRQRGGR